MKNVLTESAISGLFCSVTELSDAVPYRIDVGFSRRFKIWKTQILPCRMNEIRKEQSVEFVHRMMTLLFSGADALTNRAIKEFAYSDNLTDIIKEIDEVAKNEIECYLAEINNIKLKAME